MRKLVFASPMVDNGYDVSDYYQINPLYGTMEDMEALISEASKKNIRVVMDLVRSTSAILSPYLCSGPA